MLMNLRKLILVAFCLMSATGVRAAEQKMYLLHEATLAAHKAQLAAGDKALQPAFDALIKDADNSLQSSPFSVMQKTTMPDSGDKHDYMSMGPYWWPDPKKADGKPYIRRDGEVNPESRDSGSDQPAMGKMRGNVETLALAYYFTGQEKYATHAAKLLRVWFLEDATKMNPNLNFGQAIPGITNGRGIGIIETAGLPQMLDSVALLQTSPSWTKADNDGLKNWMGAYLDWLLNSKNGKDEAKTDNNHGTWYDVQVAGLALFVGKDEIAKAAIESAQKRLVKQIEPDGKQPHELARTKGFSYSTMNLTAFFNLADLGRAVGIDLWNYQSDDKRSLRRALDFLAPFADDKKWEHQQIHDADYQMALLPLLKRGANFQGANYNAIIEKMASAKVQANRAQLLY